MKIQRPRVGQTIKVHGMLATIIKVHPFGTIDCQVTDGRCFRVTGLGWV